MQSSLYLPFALIGLLALPTLPVAIAQEQAAQATATQDITANDAAAAASVAHAHNLSRAFRHAANTATPSVVAITVRMQPAQGNGPQRGGLDQVPPEIRRFLEQFGGDLQFDPFGGGDPVHPAAGTGSGVIIDPRGIILTNNHVVQGASELIVQLADGRTFRGANVKNDKLTDLAIFSIEGADNLQAIPIGRSSEMEIGDWVIAIGSPFEMHHTVSAGIISGKKRSIQAANRAQFLQTDAAINPGNSGGPLVNLKGELIGINTAIASRSGGYNGIGFAIPSDTVSWVMRELLTDGVVDRAYLGVQIQELTAELGKQFGLPPRGGVVVSGIVNGSPGHAAGLVPGDVITHFAGQSVRTPADLQATVERAPLKVPHRVQLLRDGNALAIDVTLAALPTTGPLTRAASPGQSPNVAPQSVTSDKLGLVVTPNPADTSGVKITQVLPGSLASRAGIPAGSLLQSINRQPITSTADFAQQAEAASVEQGVMLQIRTSNGSAFIVLRGT